MTGDLTEGTPLRDLVVQAGLDVLDRDGLGLGSNSISYASVFQHLEHQYSIRVTRASVHNRVWASHDEYRRDVLTEAVQHFPTEVSEAEEAVLSSTVNRILEQGLDGPARISEFARIVGHDLFKATMHAPGALQVQSLKALACRLHDEETTREMQRRIGGRAEGLLAIRSERFLWVMDALQLKVKSHLGLSAPQASNLFYAMALNLFLGGALNSLAGCRSIAESVDFGKSTIDDGKPWLFASIGLEAFLEFLFDVDDEVSLHGQEQLATTPVPATSAILSPPPVPFVSARRSREELKHLVLSAGVEVLLAEGLNLRPESLHYATVFSYLKEQHGIEIQRSYVHNRLWASNEEYWLEVLTTAIQAEPDATPTAEKTEQSLSQQNSAEKRVLRPQEVEDIIRTFIPVQIGDQLKSSDHVRYQLIKAALANHQPSSAVDKLKVRVNAAHQSRVDRYSAAVRAHVLPRGFQVKPGLQMSEAEAVNIITTMALASTAGAIFDRMAGIQSSTPTVSLPRSDRPDELEDWTGPAVALRAYFEHLFEASASND